MKITIIFILLLVVTLTLSAQTDIALEAPGRTPRFGVAEFVVRVNSPSFKNPFTEVEFIGVFTANNTSIRVIGFADSQDGSVFRLRFSPEVANVSYRYELTFKGGGYDRTFTGTLQSKSSNEPGPVIVDPVRPKHFIYEGSRKPFYHLGFTAYNLIDPSNDDAQVESTIDYCRRNGFNKVRFLLTGYPRDFDNRKSTDVDHGVPADPSQALNYGSLPGRLNPLPAWLGQPHHYNFERFNVTYWQRIDRAVKLMRKHGIIATCIIIIEKQDLPKELGVLTKDEYRLYRYAIARLAAFDNVWWDLGNEHNEYRNTDWGNTMGKFVKAVDPYQRLTSVHGYDKFLYSNSKWADFIITQQYGDVQDMHDWALKYWAVPKPYINEEYGYEGNTDKPVGHGQNSIWVRRCHWAIAMAGGYATYGDWSGGVSYFYMGFPGPGKAAVQLKYLRSFFEALPFSDMTPNDSLIIQGFCLAKLRETYVFYLPQGGPAKVDLSSTNSDRLNARWFDPRTGKYQNCPALHNGKNTVIAPTKDDWVLLVRNGKIMKG
ncbi:MAG TPA: DUF4038 domain-containing protein [Paludibacter sp.]|nr:DUF4038 domain-containing protein [Paludibacter sp.]